LDKLSDTSGVLYKDTNGERAGLALICHASAVPKVQLLPL